MGLRDLVFISYSHDDREWQKKLQIWLKPLVRNNQLKVWADTHIQIGDEWRRDIDEALARTRIAVLLVTPNFIASDFVYDVELPALLQAVKRQHARLFWVPVRHALYHTISLDQHQAACDPGKPLLEMTEAERDRALGDLALEIAKAFEGMDTGVRAAAPAEHRAAPAAVVPLATPAPDIAPKLGRLYDVPPQRPHVVARPADLATLKAKLLHGATQAVGLIGQRYAVGLQGMGGIGKTVLTIALTADEEVQHSFPDGVFWVQVSQTPDLVGLQRRLLHNLGVDATNIRTLTEGQHALRDALQDKQALLILDDVWHTEHARRFDVLGRHGRLLLTTRDGSILTALGAEEERLDKLTPDLAREVLAEWTDTPAHTLPQIADAVAKACGYLPLALSVAAALVRDGRSWTALHEALRASKLRTLDHPYANVFQTLRLSVDALAEADAERYRDLAVFPEDTAIPIVTIQRLWEQTGALAPHDAEALLTRFERRALLYLETQAEDTLARVRFHDLQHDFLRLTATDLPQRHADLLNAHRPPSTPTPWRDLPADEPYMWDHLVPHLTEAERIAERQATVLDLRYLVQKSLVRHPYAAESDLEQAVQHTPDDDTLHHLHRRFGQASHLLAGCTRTHDAEATLFTRLAQDATLAAPLARLRSALAPPYLAPIRSLPDLPNPAFIRALEGHSGGVNAVAFDPQGQRLASASYDGTVRLWDAHTGQHLQTLEGHSGGVNAVAFDPQGQRLASASHDGTVRLWDAHSGTCLLALRVNGPLYGCAWHGPYLAAAGQFGVYFFRVEG